MLQEFFFKGRNNLHRPGLYQKASEGFLFIIITLAFFFNLLCAKAFPQDVSEKEISRAVEKAIKSLEAKKKKDDEQLATNLKSRLESAISSWVAAAKSEKAKDLNKLLHERWSGMEIKDVTFPIPYDYYLKGLDYLVTKADCLKTDSVVSPYQAYAEILEKLYIESYHPSNVSDVAQYRCIATRPIIVRFEYSSDSFVVIGVEYGRISFERKAN